jgi:indolepyruvate ferredoxin oxidoreductase beta subunit
MTAIPQRPITILIAALGGEGGGVLTGWIVAAAERLGFPTQSTSVPGVAQRTGATTYYVEILPTRWTELGERRPVLALTPGIGDIDLMVASELLEGGRAVSAGFVTPDRTLMLASTSRAYLVVEKMAMGDGRYDSERLRKAIQSNACEAVFLDFEQLAKQSGAMVNAVMLGAIAGCGKLPIPVEAFEEAIRDDGKGMDANLRGFRTGLNAMRSAAAAVHPASSGRRGRAATPSLAAMEQEIRTTIPPVAQPIVLEGVRRLVAYQDLAYARRYLNRLGPVRRADERSGAGGRLLAETGRHLAVRMSFEDLIRVAQAKIEPARFARIAEELKVAGEEPFVIVEFLKPGIEEVCSILPPRLARWILRLSERRGWLGQVHVGMQVKTTSVFGFLRLWLLSRLRAWRPRSFRYQEEQKAIESWLGLIAQAAEQSAELALEVVECARLIKGYGDTHKRGTSNYQTIERRVILPVLGSQLPLRQGIDVIASARVAALADPEGEGLAHCLAEFDQQAGFRVAAE